MAILIILLLIGAFSIWKYIRKNLILESGIIISIKEYRLLLKYTLGQKDHLLSFSPINKEINNLFIVAYREKKKLHPELIANHENIFNECKRKIFNLWWLYKPEAIVSQEEKEIINRLAPAFIPSVKDLSKLYRFSSDTSLKQVDFLINSYNNDAQGFYEKICQIDEAESLVIVSREILLQAYRFLVSHNRAYSLMCYLQYLNVKTYSDTFKHKTIATKYNKLLFKNKEQKEYFDGICKQLLASKDIAKAIESLEKISGIKKKIELNSDAIKEAGKEQSEIAKVLEQYLTEEEESAPHKITLPENTQSNTGLIELFISNNFRLSKQEVLLFAQERKLFPNQLIQKINEIHYEALDDLLIEEEEEYYLMSEEYCKLLGLKAES